MAKTRKRIEQKAAIVRVTQSGEIVSGFQIGI